MYNNRAVKGGSIIRPVLFCGKITEKQRDRLRAIGYEPLTLPPFSLLDQRVASHPDMLLFPLGDSFLLHRSYYEENAAFFDALPVALTKSDESMGKDYPQDVLFNALPLGDTVYGGASVSRYIKEAFAHHVCVKQGYTRCSCATVGQGIITADRTVAKALSANGVDVLLISHGHIALPGYDYGFIGGASLTLSPTLTAFFGNVGEHPDYPAMSAFAQRHNATLLSLSDEPLCDLGGGFPVASLQSH